MPESIEFTPWDAGAFAIDTYELKNDAEETLRATLNKPGHFTVKVDPLASKKRLHDFGFYYCDTLLKPICSKDRFYPFDDKRISLTEEAPLEALVNVSSGIYRHGRFHRDFNLDKRSADRRYDRWLSQLYNENRVRGLLYGTTLAGFIGIADNRILLQALKKEFQGRGLAKYFWTSACRKIFSEGYDEIATSISACNLAMANLVTSLGFRFKEAVDVYHKYNP